MRGGQARLKRAARIASAISETRMECVQVRCQSIYVTGLDIDVKKSTFAMIPAVRQQDPAYVEEDHVEGQHRRLSEN